MDNRIGKRTAAGVVYPALDINGRAYTRPATIHAVGDALVVIPSGFNWSTLPARLAALGIADDPAPEDVSLISDSDDEDGDAE